MDKLNLKPEKSADVIGEHDYEEGETVFLVDLEQLQPDDGPLWSTSTVLEGQFTMLMDRYTICVVPSNLIPVVYRLPSKA